MDGLAFSVHAHTLRSRETRLLSSKLFSHIICESRVYRNRNFGCRRLTRITFSEIKKQKQKKNIFILRSRKKEDRSDCKTLVSRIQFENDDHALLPVLRGS